MNKTIRILNANEIEQKITRLAWEIYENNLEERQIIIVGLADRGIVIGRRIAKHVTKISPIQVLLGKIVLDKDKPSNKVLFDLKPSDISKKVVILVDDVLNSGQTLMYGAKYLLDTPLKKLSIAVLVNRRHNSYPIKADFSGLSLSTTLQEYVTVKLSGKNQGAYLS